MDNFNAFDCKVYLSWMDVFEWSAGTWIFIDKT